LAIAQSRATVVHKGGETGSAYGGARLARIAAIGEPPEEVPKLRLRFGHVRNFGESQTASARQRERFKALYAVVKLEFRR
jgi:hypothetical protein